MTTILIRQSPHNTYAPCSYRYHHDLSQIKTLLFDCDNTLVLSEPLAFLSCSRLANQILSQYSNSSHRYTPSELQREFVGKNFRGLIAGLEAAHGFTIPKDDIQSWVDREFVDTLELIKQGAVPCDGIVEVLEELKREGKYDMAVVSSSALPRVIASLEKTNLIRFFPHHKIFSAASMVPPTSKPDPAVYLHACESLGVEPPECIAFEDSRSGATAAVRAGIWLVGYVGVYEDEGEEEVERMKGVMREVGAKGIMGPWKEFRQVISKIEGL
jgi:HAD superfamily hydrolase (TIGR01509 family)